MNRPHQSSIVIANIPRYGLCNCLLVWAKAYAFSRQHDLPLLVHGWKAWHIGPWIRGERVKRYYGNYFVRQGNLVEFWKMNSQRKKSTHHVVVEPKHDSPLEPQTQYYVFEEVPHRDDFFAGLRGSESQIRDGFFAMLRPWLHEAKSSLQKPEVAIHVRRGDYHASGHAITPIEYYAEQLQRIRSIRGEDTPAILFSDAHDHELKELLELPGVSRSNAQKDILDLIQMMSSEYIVTSLQSTFGYWAGFLSRAAIILHPEHKFGFIRDPDCGLFEGSGEQLTAEFGNF